MPRIVLVGAGSVEFTRNLLGDILTSPALRTSEIALHDIDPERLATAERMARWTAAALSADPIRKSSREPAMRTKTAAARACRPSLLVRVSWACAYGGSDIR